MKCYYEILGIARDADDGEIKIAYRKLALKWHPDKNIENPEFAKEQFQLVQQAYEVLSDRQERAWYDNHREQILRGSDSTYTDDSLDVFPYFSSQCFSGYGDDEKGFYTVYRKVFEKIANEDMQHMEFKEDFIEIPGFGNSKSDYKEVVAPFYAYWSNYSTKKSYVWLDPYNINDTVNRRHARLVEKENKKIRQKAKKERNEEIQNLVAFVRKRDKRVEAHAKLIEAAKAEKRKKQEELRKQKILERKKELHEDNTQAEWSKFDNLKDELKLIEKNLAEEFGESVSDSDECEEEYCDNPDELFCAACNKLFKSKKARINHDSSKKHRENLSNLIRHLQETEELYEKTADESDKEEKSLHTDDENNESQKQTTTDDSEEEEEEINTKKSKKVKNKKVIRVDNHPIDIHFDSDEEIELEPDEVLGSSKKDKKQKQKSKQNGLGSDASEEAPELVAIDSSDYEFSTTKKNKKKKQKTKQATVPNDIEKEEKTIQNQVPNINKKNKQNKKDVKKDLPNIEGIDTSHTCVKCQSVFTSKNKLFDHLKKTGHSIALPQKDTKAKKKIK